MMDAITRLFVSAQVLTHNRLRREEGQALVEYALILMLIAVVCIAILATLGGKVKDVLTTISNAL